MDKFLMHFNSIHMPAGRPNGGQFGPGDGDGDGIVNDHANRKQLAKIEKRDNKWAKKNYSKLTSKAYKPIRKDMHQFVRTELNPKYAKQIYYGKIGKNYMKDYNKKLAELMNLSIGDLPTAPSGRVVQFIAKRGDIGVHLALADPNYDMSQFKSGVYNSGRIAYKKTYVNKA